METTLARVQANILGNPAKLRKAKMGVVVRPQSATKNQQVPIPAKDGKNQ
jgi:hypothetical protein